MKLDLLKLFQSQEVDDKNFDLICAVVGTKGLIMDKIADKAHLEKILTEIYQERLADEEAPDFVEQTLFIAELYKAGGLYNQAASIYAKLAAFHPENEEYRDAITALHRSLN